MDWEVIGKAMLAIAGFFSVVGTIWQWVIKPAFDLGTTVNKAFPVLNEIVTDFPDGALKEQLTSIRKELSTTRQEIKNLNAKFEEFIRMSR